MEYRKQGLDSSAELGPEITNNFIMKVGDSRGRCWACTPLVSDIGELFHAVLCFPSSHVLKHVRELRESLLVISSMEVKYCLKVDALTKDPVSLSNLHDAQRCLLQIALPGLLKAR